MLQNTEMFWCHQMFFFCFVLVQEHLTERDLDCMRRITHTKKIIKQGLDERK